MSNREMMKITLKQQKVISDPLRSRIIAMLHEEPMTPKQTAEKLDKNAGTIYYHIQQLFKHDILEIDHVDTNKGVVEKYYRSKAILFQGPEQEASEEHVTGSNIHILLSKKLLDEMHQEVQEIYFKYGRLSIEETEEQNSYTVEFNVKNYIEEEKG